MDLRVVAADAASPAPEPLMRALLGETLRSVRQRQGRTLKEVSTDAGVSMTYLSEVERGQKEASSEVIAAITRALGGSLIDLLAEMSGQLVGADTTVASGADRAATLAVA
ncbi:helix-turn-helix domain-containing protein [Jongsikchunia kroppenstedtii]|mgnify:CR=1 FL=1|uniref:helix-turn-helix domain-containing protein n=1 Tax=Jongsikchunia kroppenstedtii TaxID=1121721 RepID=UPI000360DDFD|nr:helix-turn-helix transcriptional regulator [Jongsikchunia kroppenstedtii]